MKNIAKIMLVFLGIAIIVSPITNTYWAENVDEVDTSGVSLVSIGSWYQIFEWEATANYSEGDIVTWNGITYIRNHRAHNLNPQPDGFLGWLVWDEE